MHKFLVLVQWPEDPPTFRHPPVKYASKQVAFKLAVAIAADEQCAALREKAQRRFTALAQEYGMEGTRLGQLADNQGALVFDDDVIGEVFLDAESAGVDRTVIATTHWAEGYSRKRSAIETDVQPDSKRTKTERDNGQNAKRIGSFFKPSVAATRASGSRFTIAGPSSSASSQRQPTSSVSHMRTPSARHSLPTPKDPLSSQLTPTSAQRPQLSTNIASQSPQHVPVRAAHVTRKDEGELSSSSDDDATNDPASQLHSRAQSSQISVDGQSYAQTELRSSQVSDTRMPDRVRSHADSTLGRTQGTYRVFSASQSSRPGQRRHRSVSNSLKWTEEEDAILVTASQRNWNTRRIVRALSKIPDNDTKRSQSAVRGRRFLLLKKTPHRFKKGRGTTAPPDHSSPFFPVSSQTSQADRAVATDRSISQHRDNSISDDEQTPSFRPTRQNPVLPLSKADAQDSLFITEDEAESSMRPQRVREGVGRGAQTRLNFAKITTHGPPQSPRRAMRAQSAPMDSTPRKSMPGLVAASPHKEHGDDGDDESSDLDGTTNGDAAEDVDSAARLRERDEHSFPSDNIDACQAMPAAAPRNADRVARSNRNGKQASQLAKLSPTLDRPLPRPLVDMNESQLDRMRLAPTISRSRPGTSDAQVVGERTHADLLDPARLGNSRLRRSEGRRRPSKNGKEPIPSILPDLPKTKKGRAVPPVPISAASRTPRQGTLLFSRSMVGQHDRRAGDSPKAVLSVNRPQSRKRARAVKGHREEDESSDDESRAFQTQDPNTTRSQRLLQERLTTAAKDLPPPEKSDDESLAFQTQDPTTTLSQRLMREAREAAEREVAMRDDEHVDSVDEGPAGVDYIENAGPDAESQDLTQLWRTFVADRHTSPPLGPLDADQASTNHDASTRCKPLSREVNQVSSLKTKSRRRNTKRRERLQQKATNSPKSAPKSSSHPVGEVRRAKENRDQLELVYGLLSYTLGGPMWKRDPAAPPRPSPSKYIRRLPKELLVISDDNLKRWKDAKKAAKQPTELRSSLEIYVGEILLDRMLLARDNDDRESVRKWEKRFKRILRAARCETKIAKEIVRTHPRYSWRVPQLIPRNIIAQAEAESADEEVCRWEDDYTTDDEFRLDREVKPPRWRPGKIPKIKRRTLHAQDPDLQDQPPHALKAEMDRKLREKRLFAGLRRRQEAQEEQELEDMAMRRNAFVSSAASDESEMYEPGLEPIHPFMKQAAAGYPLGGRILVSREHRKNEPLPSGALAQDWSRSQQQKDALVQKVWTNRLLAKQGRTEYVIDLDESRKLDAEDDVRRKQAYCGRSPPMPSVRGVPCFGINERQNGRKVASKEYRGAGPLEDNADDSEMEQDVESDGEDDLEMNQDVESDREDVESLRSNDDTRQSTALSDEDADLEMEEHVATSSAADREEDKSANGTEEVVEEDDVPTSEEADNEMDDDAVDADPQAEDVDMDQDDEDMEQNDEERDQNDEEIDQNDEDSDQNDRDAVNEASRASEPLESDTISDKQAVASVQELGSDHHSISTNDETPDGLENAAEPDVLPDADETRRGIIHRNDSTSNNSPGTDDALHAEVEKVARDQSLDHVWDSSGQLPPAPVKPADTVMGPPTHTSFGGTTHVDRSEDGINGQTSRKTSASDRPASAWNLVKPQADELTSSAQKKSGKSRRQRRKEMRDSVPGFERDPRRSSVSDHPRSSISHVENIQTPTKAFPLAAGAEGISAKTRRRLRKKEMRRMRQSQGPVAQPSSPANAIPNIIPKAPSPPESRQIAAAPTKLHDDMDSSERPVPPEAAISSAEAKSTPAESPQTTSPDTRPPKAKRNHVNGFANDTSSFPPPLNPSPETVARLARMYPRPTSFTRPATNMPTPQRRPTRTAQNPQSEGTVYNPIALDGNADEDTGVGGKRSPPTPTPAAPVASSTRPVAKPAQPATSPKLHVITSSQPSAIGRTIRQATAGLRDPPPIRQASPPRQLPEWFQKLNDESDGSSESTSD